MAGAHVEVDKKLKSMVMCFRVCELQVLLGHAGRNKSGRKHELLTRALQLIRANGCNKSIQAKVHDLYQQRYPNNAVIQPHFPKSEHIPSPGCEAVNGKTHNLNPHFSIQQPYIDSHHFEARVKFKPLPFYEHLSNILCPVALCPRSGRALHEQTCKFTVTAQQFHQMRYESKVQLQLRFCLLNTTCEQSDKLPPNLCVKINRSSVHLPAYIPPTKTGVSPKRPNLPITVGSLCRTYGDFSLEVKWSDEEGKSYNDIDNNSFCVTIVLVQQLSVDELLFKLKQPNPLPSSHTREVIRQKLSKDQDCEISTTSLKVSILCPLGKMRMKIPVRPSTCRHLQCFDASIFLCMNERKATWTCPVCDQPAEFKDLVVDGLFVEILESCKTDEIEFTEDGDWHAAAKKTETLIIGTPTMKPIGILHSVETVDLIEESDVQIRSRAKSSAKFQETAASESSTRKDLSQSGCRIQEELKAKEPEIIDLTCDSSEDEVSPYKAVSTSPSVISDGTPMSITSSPIEVGSPSVRSNKLEVPLFSHTSTCRESPSLSKRNNLKRLTPSSSPYRRNDSPQHYTLPQLPAANSPFASISPRISPRSIHTPLAPHSSPLYPLPNSLITTSPAHLASSHTTPPTLPSLPIPPLDVGLSGYPTSLSLMNSLNDPPLPMTFHPGPYDFQNQPYFHYHPLIFPPHLPRALSYDMYNRGPQISSVSSADTRTHNRSQRYGDDDFGISGIE